MAYSLSFGEGWDEYFQNFDATIQKRLMKKIQKLKKPLKHRHLKRGLPYFVEGTAGYRIAFNVNEENKTKTIWFAGTHKQYEKWYSGK